jgi:hypothetical protein
MGIDLYCDNVSYSGSYSGWNEIRKIVIRATFDYIQDKFQRDLELNTDLTENGEGSQYDFYKKYIIEFINIMKMGEKDKNIFGIENDNTINNFINIARRNFDYVNALIYFDINGIYTLCNKNDCEGFYSPGNSLDICQLFDLIEPFVEKISVDIHYEIYLLDTNSNFSENRLYDLFKESVSKNKKIIIT